MPLIAADQTFALSAVIMLIVAFGLWAESRPWGQKIGGPLVLLAISMALANLGVIPYAAPVYDQIAGLLVPMAIPLLIMRADFRTIFVESGPMFLTFLIAAAVTFIGALVGVWLIDMGPLEAQIADEVAGGDYDLIAIAAEAHGDFVQQVLQEIEDRTLHADRPILVIKPSIP